MNELSDATLEAMARAHDAVQAKQLGWTDPWHPALRGTGGVTDSEFAKDRIEAARAAWEASPGPGLVEALEEIAKGMGAFNRDPLIHASNTIDEMKEIARLALSSLGGSER